MQKITPFLWFDGQAEEAVRLYTSLFPNSSIKNETRYGEGMPVPKGTIMTIVFTLFGQEFVALNAGPQFSFSEATSFVVNCEGQEEVDRYWNALTEGGTAQPCGWLKDRFGLSWQIIPTILPELLRHEDSEKSKRVTQAMLKMTKIDIAKLRDAAELVS